MSSNSCTVTRPLNLSSEGVSLGWVPAADRSFIVPARQEVGLG